MNSDEKNKPIRAAVFVSGEGTNLEAILESTENGILKGKIEVAVVISDNIEARALQRAAKYKVASFIADKNDFGKEAREEEYLKIIKKYEINLIVLAGYSGILSPHFIEETEKEKIPCLNIHPTPTDQYRGAEGYKWVAEQQISVNFPTMHIVTENFDEGPVLLYGLPYYSLYSVDKIDELKEKGLREEHRLITTVLNHLADGAIKIENKEVHYSVQLGDFKKNLCTSLREMKEMLDVIAYAKDNQLRWTIRFDQCAGGKKTQYFEEISGEEEIEDLLGFTLLRKEMACARPTAENPDLNFLFNFLRIPLVYLYDSQQHSGG